MATSDGHGPVGAPSSSNVTVLDVARAAGVSRATAARAIGGYGQVGPRARARVMAAVEELGYRSNELARSMRSGRTNTIGLVIADISSAFFEQATLAIVRAAAAKGYQTLLLNSDEDVAKETHAVGVLLDKRVDGMIVVTSRRIGHDHLLKDGKLLGPLVLLDRRADDVPAVSVSTDDRRAATDAVAAFVRHGHRRIGMISTSSTVAGQRVPQDSPMAISTAVDRMQGFLAGLKAAGIPVDTDLVRFTDPDHDAAAAAVVDMLSRDDPPTALLASNAEMALAVLDGAKKLDVEIGRDLSLIGFDDSRWAPLMTPALSVISRPVYELGTMAADMLIEQIEGRDTGQESVVMPARLLERASIGPVTQ